jgi:hypothetical protein
VSQFQVGTWEREPVVDARTVQYTDGSVVEQPEKVIETISEEVAESIELPISEAEADLLGTDVSGAEYTEVEVPLEGATVVVSEEVAESIPTPAEVLVEGHLDDHDSGAEQVALTTEEVQEEEGTCRV